MPILTIKIFTILLLFILFIGCASNQNKYARKNDSQGELDDYLTDDYSQGELDDYHLTDDYSPVLPIRNAPKKSPKEYLISGPSVDTKKLITKDGLMYKPKLYIKLFGPGKPFTGKAITYFISGSKESEGTYLNGKKDGNWTYWYYTYDQNTNIESKGYYKLGKRDGLWEYWYPNGEKREVGNFNNQERIGKWRYYNEDGLLHILISY